MIGRTRVKLQGLDKSLQLDLFLYDPSDIIRNPYFKTRFLKLIHIAAHGFGMRIRISYIRLYIEDRSPVHQIRSSDMNDRTF